MNTPRKYWTDWAQFLRQHRLTELALWLFEAGNPLSILGAQFFYMAQPFAKTSHLQALAETLENDKEAEAFADFLRKEMTT